MTSPRATYLYCVLRAARRPSFDEAPAGLPRAGRPRALDAGDALWVIAASVPLIHYGRAPIERGLSDLTWVSRCAVAHEAVVEYMLRRGAVVPMKLFTIFKSDERALSFVARERDRLDAVIARIAGSAEWGVRVMFGPRGLSRTSTPRRQPAGAAVSGAGYLRTKQELRDVAREITSGAQARIDQLFERLARSAADARRHTPVADHAAGSRLLLDAAYLVARGKTRAFRSAVSAAARELSSQGYTITLSGPWPAYNFVAEAK